MSLVLAVLAAPAAGLCAAFVGEEDPCAMRDAHEAASCGHVDLLMTGCCDVESVDVSAEGILPGSTADGAPPAPLGSGPALPAPDGSGPAALACDGDPPLTVPRYRLYSVLLL